MSQNAIKTSSCWCGIIWSIFGIILCIVGIVLLIIFRSIIYKDIIEKKLPLKENSDGSYDEVARKWATPPFTEMMQFWIFDVTNPLEIMYNGAKPRVIEKGPYGFRQTDIKRNISYSTDGTWVVFHNDRTWFWWSEHSCENCKITDLVTVPNLIYLSAVSSIERLFSNGTGCDESENCADPLKLIDLALLLLGEEPFVRVPVGELLFTGYKDPMVSIEHVLKKIPVIRDISFLKNIPDMKAMAFFYGYNGTDDGEYMMKTGLNDVNQLGQIMEWHEKKSLSWWNSAEANKLRGAPDGSFFKPFLTTKDTLPIFLSYCCRSLDLVYQKKMKFRKSNVYRYVLPDDIFNYTIKKNQDYWPKTRVKPPDGLLNIPCQPGRMVAIRFSAYFSAPHFTNCDPNVINSIDGVYPDREAYRLGSWDLEPITGTSFHVQFRVQINIPIRRNSKVTMLRNLREDTNLPENQTYIPLLWLKESVTIDDNTYSEIRAVTGPLIIGAYVGMALAVIIGILIIIFCCACCFCKGRRKSDVFTDGPLITETNNPRNTNSSAQPTITTIQQRYDNVPI